MLLLFMDIFIPILLLVWSTLSEELGSSIETFFVAVAITVYVLNVLDDFKKYWRK